MSGDVLTKDLRDRRVPVVALGGFLFVMSVFALGLYSGLQETFDKLTEDMPEELLTFIGGDTPGGYVLGEIFSLIAPLAMVGYAVMAGASATAGEEERKTLGVLVAQPVTRRSILLSKAAGMVLAVLVIGVLFWVGTTASAAGFDIAVDTGGVAAACLHLALLAIMFGMVALAAGAVTGKPGTAAAVAGGLAVAAYLADSMLPLADLDSWAELSPWFYYFGSDPLRNGVDFVHLLVLATIAVVALLAAVRAFERRDLRG